MPDAYASHVQMSWTKISVCWSCAILFCLLSYIFCAMPKLPKGQGVFVHKEFMLRRCRGDIVVA